MFSSKSFKILALRVISLIHFELIILYYVRSGSSLFFKIMRLLWKYGNTFTKDLENTEQSYIEFRFQLILCMLCGLSTSCWKKESYSPHWIILVPLLKSLDQRCRKNCQFYSINLYVCPCSDFVRYFFCEMVMWFLFFIWLTRYINWFSNVTPTLHCGKSPTWSQCRILFTCC